MFSWVVNLASLPQAAAAAATGKTQTPSFERFNDLPTELRLKIWGYAQPEQRVHRIFYDNDEETWQSHAKPIALLSTCWESRHVMLRAYGQLANPGQPPIYFDFARDALYLDWQSFPMKCSGAGVSLTFPFAAADLTRIQTLVVDQEAWNWTWGRSFEKRVREFAALRTCLLGEKSKELSCTTCNTSSCVHVMFADVEPMPEAGITRGLKTAEEGAALAFLDLQVKYPDWKMPTTGVVSLTRPAAYY